MKLEIIRFSPRGFGVGYLKESKVEVAHSVPGDLLEIDLKRGRKRIKKGKLQQVISPSSDRISPPCPHAMICGGCTWQQIDYAAQLRYKEKMVEEIFSHKVLPIIPCEDPWHYRNKMEFSFSENAANAKFLGLMIAHAASYVFNVQSCLIANPWFSEVVQKVRLWWENSNLLAYHPKKNRGTLRYLTLREGIHTKERMIILTVMEDLPQEYQKSFVQQVEATTIVLRKQKSQKGVAITFEEVSLIGSGTISEKLSGLTFTISPSSFFQPNTRQAEKLYQAAFAMLPSVETALDLYSGTGTLGLCLASRVKKVIAIEINEEAVKNAKENMERNCIYNFEIYQGDVGKVLTQLRVSKNFTYPDLVIVDPPRGGLDPKAIGQILSLRPRWLLYISCNPKTQAENILALKGYSLQKLQPVDQFPHTVHIENIALLELIS